MDQGAGRSGGPQLGKFYARLIVGFAAFARSEFELGVVQKVDGKTLRQHLQSIHRQTGRMPEQLANAAPLPDGCDALWLDFMALHQMRSSNGFGPSRITYSDMAAMQDVRGVTLEAWEVDAIRAADAACLAAMAEAA